MKAEDLAFPATFRGQYKPEEHNGLTKREYFAAKIMQAILISHKIDQQNAAELSIKYADALIEALNK